MTHKTTWLIAALCGFQSFLACAQSVTDLRILKGLAPVARLSQTSQGIAALSANYAITASIQTGAFRQSTLLPFAQEQQQALQDAFITGGNLTQLADGLGTTLAAGYVARAHYIDRTHFTNLSEPLADLIAYAEVTSGRHAGAGKYFLANATTDGKNPVSDAAAAIFQDIGGATDIFGRSYRLPAGATGADVYGNSRPFQTEPTVLPIFGHDYFNLPADNGAYNRGPLMNLINSPSFPSGHTNYGYAGALILAVMVPARYQQMITRAAQYANSRILVGAHYVMDVIGGRTLALYDMAHLLANDPAYVGRSARGLPVIKDFRGAMLAARPHVAAILQKACGNTIQECAREDIGRFSNSAANEAFYAQTQTYDLPVVYPQNADSLEDIGKLAPEAGYLLTVAFPSLSLERADRILTETEGPGGGFLDDGSSFGVYSRLDLYAAAARAAEFASPH